MKRNTVPILPLFIFILWGCEKTANIRLKDTEPKLVVEATIENGQAPIVILSRSLNYFSSINPTIIENNFVRFAEIYISNGTKTHRLKEYSKLVGGQVKIYYYSIDTSDLATAFNGELNTTYSLRILSENKEYTATTTIPNLTRRVDSLFWRPAPPGNKPEKVAVYVRAKDQPGFGDYVRYFTKTNSEPFYPGINSVFDDQIIDGISYQIQVERGVDRNTDREDDYVYFNKGDTVTLKLANIDKSTFDFWRTMEFAYANLGNPFSTPTKISGNISNGALGYFGGYAAQFHTIIIPK